MGRTSEDPVQHVISFRVNDEEKDELEKLANSFGVSISTLMRHCISDLNDRLVHQSVSQKDY